jgi:uridine phosphorylase
MSYPMTEGKHALRAVVPLPVGRGQQNGPAAAILCYPRWLLREVVESEPTTVFEWGCRGDVHQLDATGGAVALVGGIGVGGPSAAMLVEELGAHGVQRFIVVGLAGALTDELGPCAVAVCDRALRDEGVSHHYLPPGRYVAAGRKLSTRLGEELRQDGVAVRVGPTWTTDAPYRETAEEVRRYRTAGIVTVEMEAASVFAVAEARGYEAAAGFVVSDHLTADGWVGHFHEADLRSNLRILLSAAIRTLGPHRSP